MTTCIWDSNILYADRLIHGGVVETADKYRIIFKGTPKETLLFSAGGVVSAHRMYDWLEGGEKPDFGSEKVNFTLVAIRKDTKQIKVYYAGFHPVSTDSKLIVIGSGREYALGALAAGASTIEAMKIAAKYDRHTGTEIDIVNFI